MTEMTPGWQPDPTGRHDHRYWDGSRWTDDVADAGVAAKDPFDGPAAEPGAEADSPSSDPAPTQPEAPVAQDPAPTVAGPLPPQDPTAAWPAAGATPPPAGGFGTPPPVSPEAPPAAAASGGSKKGFLIGLGILVLIAVGVGAFLLLGDDDDGDGGNDRVAIRAAMISELSSDGFLSEQRAGCVADHIIDELGVDRLKGVDFSASEPPPGLEDDFLPVYEDALAECRETGSGTDGGFGLDDGGDDGSDDIGDDGDDLGDDGFGDDGDDFGSDFGSDLGSDFGSDFGSDSMPGVDMEEMLTDIYADMFDLSRDKAECLAGKMVDAMDSSNFDEDDFMGDIFQYLDDCDISMSELGAN